MRETLSPKQVARAIGVSESSLKRWCDQGLLPMVRTAGGHRRLPLSGVLDFLQQSGRELAEPEVLGLPAAVGTGQRVLATAAEQLAEALIAGQEEAARSILVDLFLQHHSLASIGDEVVSKAFRQIGERWACGEAEVYQERQSCQMMSRIIAELGRLIPAGQRQERAIGGSCEGDYYQIPSSLVELVFAQHGYRANSLGENIPFTSLRAAIEQHRPKMFWLSLSHVSQPATIVEQFNGLYDQAHRLGIAFVVGGYAITPELRRQLKFTTCCDNLQQLELFLEAYNPASA